jgi:transposase
VTTCAQPSQLLHHPGPVSAALDTLNPYSWQVLSTSAKEYAVTSPKDIPYGEDRIVVRWNKVRWRCREDCCERKSFTEAIAQVPARARSTVRLRVQMAKAVGEAARSVAEVAQAHAVSWSTAHRAFVAHAETVLTEPAPTAVLGIDETRRGKPRWQRCAKTGRWARGRPVGHRFCRPGR